MSSGTESWIWNHPESKRDDEGRDCPGSGNDVWKSVKDGEGWTNMLYQGGGQEKNIQYYSVRQGSVEYRDEKN